ncbi:hypothetical protein FACS1894195_0850 [Bacteroidia bacterium]|nr:hypothetical protein FACS1894195_0850 [Bacteroidia bacterium]
MTAKELQKEIQSLWKIVSRLETEYKDDKRKFTLDGHFLGSLGEVYAKEEFHLELLTNSEKAHDAIDKNGDKYQIKITQRDKVGIRYAPDNLIVIAINKEGLPETIYKGKGKLVWDLIKHKKQLQKTISIKQLKELNFK